MLIVTSIPTKCDYKYPTDLLPLFEMPIPQVYVVTTPTVNYFYVDINRPFHKNTNVYSDSTFISLNSQLDLLSHWITSVEFYIGPKRRV